MLRKTPRKPKTGASSDAVTPGLPDERKALVERYMIDADEAVSRVRLASESEEASRRAAQRKAEEQAQHEADAALETVAHRAARAPAQTAPPASDEMPIYAWIERAKPDESATDDWTRALVEEKEARGRDEPPPT